MSSIRTPVKYRILLQLKNWIYLNTSLRITDVKCMVVTRKQRCKLPSVSKNSGHEPRWFSRFSLTGEMAVNLRRPTPRSLTATIKRREYIQDCEKILDILSRQGTGRHRNVFEKHLDLRSFWAWPLRPFLFSQQTKRRNGGIQVLHSVLILLRVQLDIGTIKQRLMSVTNDPFIFKQRDMCNTLFAVTIFSSYRCHLCKDHPGL